MKKLMLGLVAGTTLMSSAAMAGEQRPTYMAFSAPAASSNVASASTTVASPVVAKRNKSFGVLPLWVPIVGVIAVVGLVAAVSSGGGNNNGSPG